MTIETTLLLLESVLLMVTIALLLYSIREGRRRSSFILEVSKATKILTRMEYFLAVTDSVVEAKEEIIGCVTGRRPAGDDEKRVRAIINAVDKAKSRGVRVRYILPKFHDRLYMGYLYVSAGAEVRYASCSMVSSLRYVVVDDRLVVIGIPESVGRKKATRKGHRLPSKALASIMKSHFYSCWQTNVTLEEYVKEALKQTGVSVKRLALELGIEAKEFERIVTKSSPQSHGRQVRDN